MWWEGPCYLLGGQRRLAQIATIGRDGALHITPVGYAYNATSDTIDIGGHNLRGIKKCRDIERHGRFAVVIDDVLPPWRLRASRSKAMPKRCRSPRHSCGSTQNASSPRIESRASRDRHASEAKGAVP